MVRLIDHDGWEKFDDSIDPIAEVVRVRSWRMERPQAFAQAQASDSINATVTERLFYAREYRHEDGSRERIFFEEPERADEVMRGRRVTNQTRERLLLENRRAREACVLALRLVEGAGELILAEEIRAGAITDHNAAAVVERVVTRLKVEASWIDPARTERLIRAAGIPAL